MLTPLVLHESNSCSLYLAEKTKSSKIWPQVIALERKAKMTMADSNMAAYQQFLIKAHLLEFYGIWHLRDWNMAQFVSQCQ